MDFRLKLYHNNKLCFDDLINENIVIENKDVKYSIYVKDLYEYLESKNTSQTKYIINEIINSSIEPNDEFMILNDENLIKVASKLLKDAKKMKITEYYKQKMIYFRPFNLIGLVSNNIIECESKRKTIRDLCRKCHEFLYLNSKKEYIQILNEKKLIEECPDPINQSEEEITIQSHSKTCIYEFKRGELKGKLCGKQSLENKSYCSLCINRVNEKKNLQQLSLTPQIKTSI